MMFLNPYSLQVCRSGLYPIFLVLVARKETGATAKNTKLLKQEFKNTEIKQQKFWKAFLYKKWMKFGGGFYGVLTFITYLHIEIYEVIDFVQSFIGTESLIIKSVLVLFVEFLWIQLLTFYTHSCGRFTGLNTCPLVRIWFGFALFLSVILPELDWPCR